MSMKCAVSKSFQLTSFNKWTIKRESLSSLPDSVLDRNTIFPTAFLTLKITYIFYM